MFAMTMGKAPKSESRGILTGFDDIEMESDGEEERDDYEDSISIS